LCERRERASASEEERESATRAAAGEGERDRGEGGAREERRESGGVRLWVREREKRRGWARRAEAAWAQSRLLELEEGEGGNEWVTRRPHMSLRCRPASFVAVNVSVAWSKPLNVVQNSLCPCPGAKSERF